MKIDYDLIGIGAGPFHLSLAAMLEKLPDTKAMFLEQKQEFRWHPEIIFDDADMQTAFYKDLVTPVDPTSRHSYLNFLVEHGLFYAFMNTGRRVITRKEFEIYGKWVASRLENLSFNSPVSEVSFDGKKFILHSNGSKLSSRHLSVATGTVPHVPESTKAYLGDKVFHAKSGQLASIDMTGKRVVIVGGGQTGVEIFRNALHFKWGRPESLKIISRRQNLQPLDESPFTNDYFTPSYGEEFFSIDPVTKEQIVASQKLASDGNTPAYLELLYKDLYFRKYVDKDPMNLDILPMRNLTDLNKNENGSYSLILKNNFLHEEEVVEGDIVILATGLQTKLPDAIEGIRHLLELDEKGRPILSRSFQVRWQGPETNKIFALNMSRHQHGIAEPQTSLMAWRSAMIINDLVGTDFYNTRTAPAFIKYGKN